MKYIATLGDQEFVIEILDDDLISLDGETHEIDFAAVSDQPLYSLLIDGKSFRPRLATPP